MRSFFSILLFGLISLIVNSQTEFITTWKTDNPGVSENNQITIPTLPGEAYNYDVDWGDGTTDIGVTGNTTHTYASPGTYEVSISGLFPSIFFNDFSFSEPTSDAHKLLSIKEWGTNPWKSMQLAFAGCRNLVVEAMDAPDLSNVNNLQYMFYGCSRLFMSQASFNDWILDTIFNMDSMFSNSTFNQDISSWNVSNVINMSKMFWSSSFNQNINNWNVSNVRDMSYMFGSGLFNQDLSNWDVSNVTDMSFMFYATYFSKDITGWNVSNVANMESMLNQSNFDYDISNWNVSNVNNMKNMLDDCGLSDDNYNKILMGWSQLPFLQNGVELGAIDSQYCLAENARADLIANHDWIITDSGKACIDPSPFITTWKTDNIGVSNNNQITIPTNPRKKYNYTVDWGDGTSDTNVTGDITHTYGSPGTYTVSITGKFPGIFFNDHPVILMANQDLGDHDKIISIDQWGTNRWEFMNFAFAGCSNLDMIATDIPDFSRGIGSGFEMRFFDGMFLGCTSLIGNNSMDLWDMRYVTNTSWMFREASNFNQNLNNWNVSSVQNMSDMFYEATSFDQDLGNWNISNVINMDNIFFGATLSTTNYDHILIGWESQTPNNGLSFHAGNSDYCNGDLARNSLINTFGWTISDGDLDCTLDISENKYEKDLVISPNPTSDFIHINFNNLEVKKVKVFSIQGRFINEYVINDNIIDVRSLVDGVYLLQLITDKYMVSRKIIKN